LLTHVSVPVTINGGILPSTTTKSALHSLSAASGMIFMQATDIKSLNIYSTKDGSFIQNENANLGTIVVNGVSYYSAESGMVQ
jgi:hypothetical protein